MRKSKKALALALTLVCMAPLAAGCGNVGAGIASSGNANASQPPKNNGAEPSREPVEYELMFSEAASQPYEAETWLFPKVIEQKFGVKLKITPIPSSSYTDKVNMAIASQSIPDILNSVDLNTLNDMGAKGMFLNLSDYSGSMPNAQAAFASNQDLSICRLSDSQWFALPSKVPSPNLPKTSIDFITMIRGDILKKNNLSAPKTYDDLYKLFLQLKALYPDAYPWVTRLKTNEMTWCLGPSVGLQFDQSDFTMWDGSQFKTVLDDEKFRYLIEFMNKCYAEKLLDPEYAISDTKQWEDKIISGKGFFSIDYFARPETMTNAAQAGGNSEYFLEPILPPAKEGGEQKVYAKNIPVSYQGISAKAKSPERLAEVYDWWFFSEEGAMLGYFGEEGTSYTTEEGKKVLYKYTEDANSVTSIAAKFGVDYYGFCGLVPGAFGYTIDYRNDPNMTEAAKKTYEVYEGATVPSCPAVTYTGDAMEERKNFVANMQTQLVGELDKFIMGKRPMSDWEALLQEFNAQGYDKYIQAKNTML